MNKLVIVEISSSLAKHFYQNYNCPQQCMPVPWELQYWFDEGLIYFLWLRHAVLLLIKLWTNRTISEFTNNWATHCICFCCFVLMKFVIAFMLWVVLSFSFCTYMEKCRLLHQNRCDQKQRQFLFIYLFVFLFVQRPFSTLFQSSTGKQFTTIPRKYHHL